MTNGNATDLWKPDVLGTDRLDETFSAYLVRAPFDMHANAHELKDRIASLGGVAAVIRGVLSRVPAGPIAEGEMITLLARPA